MNLKGGHYNQYKTRSLSSIDIADDWDRTTYLSLIIQKLEHAEFPQKKFPDEQSVDSNLDHIDDDHDDQGGH